MTETEFMTMERRRRWALVRWAMGGDVDESYSADFRREYDRHSLREWLIAREDAKRDMPRRWVDEDEELEGLL